MDENLPEKTPDAELTQTGSEGTSAGRELTVAGGEVYLPASETVKPGEEKFEETVAEVLPEIAPSLSDEALGRSRGYSIAAVLLIFGFLCAACAALYLLTPRPEKLTYTAVGVPKPEQDTYGGRFGAEFGRAQTQIEKRQFHAARETLEPLVDTLLNDGAPHAGDDNILYSYFSLFDRLDWDDGARKRLAKLIGLAPDEYRWQFFDILSHPALARRDGGFGDPNDWKLDFTWESVVSRMKRIDALRRRHPELAKQLDLCKGYLAVNLWRLKNHEKRSARVGVEDREEAWRIAKRYGGDADFLKLRRYIVVQMLDDSRNGFIGPYTFDRRTHYSKAPLETEHGDLKNKLERKNMRKR